MRSQLLHFSVVSSGLRKPTTHLQAAQRIYRIRIRRIMVVCTR